MNLSFKENWPWGGATNFKDKILTGKKKHTIREDPNRRWKQGSIIHFCTGMRTKNYDCFALGVCTYVLSIKITPLNREDFPLMISISGEGLSRSSVDDLARDDGFEDAYEMRKWFNKPFEGVIIFWAPLDKVGCTDKETFEQWLKTKKA